MKTILIAAIVALSLPPISHAQTVGAVPEPAALRIGRIDDAQIARLKQLLRLTDAQQENWPAVEAALRRFARRSPPAGAASHVGALARTDLQQLLSAALPLIRSLDADQKRNAFAFVRSMGLLPAGAPL